MRKEEKPPKSSIRQRQAGRSNLLKFRAQNSRPALKSGVGTVIASGGAVMPPVPGAEEIREQTDALIAEMVSDMGGGTELTAQQKAIVESQRMCLLVLGLANNFIRREGLLSKRGKPHALLHTVVSFANTLRLNAVTLGLERRPRKVGPASLSEYLAQRESEKTEAPPEVEAEAVIEAEGRE